jgi:hypothetical protein
MCKVYGMLVSKDQEMKALGKQLFYALDENGMNEFIFYHLNGRFKNKLPKIIRARVATIIASGKYTKPL